MADLLPGDGYLPDLARTVGEQRDALEAVRDSLFQVLGRSPRTTLVSASGAITPDRAIHKVDTEGALATDDLTNIDPTNVPDGFWLVLQAADPARVVTLKHLAGGTGQIEVLRGADIKLNDFPRVILEWDSAAGRWREVFTTKPAGMPAALVVASIAPYTVDQGWGILAYNRVLSAASYPHLYGEVGDFYNTGGEGAGNFRVPDSRDVVLVGRGNMGGTPRGLITITGLGNPGLDTTALGATAGADRRTLSVNNLAIHGHAGGGLVAASHAHSVSGSTSSDGSHSHPYDRPNDSTTRDASGGVGVWRNDVNGFNTGSAGAHAHSISGTAAASGALAVTGTSANAGANEPFPILQPSMVVNFLYTTGEAVV